MGGTSSLFFISKQRQTSEHNDFSSFYGNTFEKNDIDKSYRWTHSLSLNRLF